MRYPTFAILFITITQRPVAADEFKAWVYLIDGKNVSFVKDDGTRGPPKTRPITLRLADNVLVLQGGFDEATKKYEGAIVEDGMDYELFAKFKKPSTAPKAFTRYFWAHMLVDADNRIAEIRLYDDLAVKILKVEGNVLTHVQMWGSGYYGGKEEGALRTRHVSPKAEIVIGWLNPATRKFEAAKLAGGLKNEIFHSTVHARIIPGSDKEGVTRIRVFDKSKIKK